ncbi:MAG: hypothetical protein Q4Q23_04440 [Methanobacteriaceae archaeon]|nr:hypothetical protein [Methanobacteriaceae archaeon]
MISKKNIEENASMVLIDTVYELFNNEEKINTFYSNLNLDENQFVDGKIDNEILDEQIINELEKHFDQKTIGMKIQELINKENERSIKELHKMIDEKFESIKSDLLKLIGDETDYTNFKDKLCNNLILNNMQFESAIKASLKELNKSSEESKVLTLLKTI